MRDTIKSEDYFLKKIQSDTARIKRFEAVLHDTDPANQRGISVGKLQLSKLYLGCAKASYSVGAELSEVYSFYLRYIGYYKDVCAPADSMYDVIDALSMGVLFQASKAEFLPDLETMAERFNSQDGLICCLLGRLRDKPLEARQSQLDYFNRLMGTGAKVEVLSLELSQWYRHHKGAYWYDSHKSRNHTYCGYWCFEIAALSKIFGIDDEPFALNPCYPYDLARY